MGLFYFYDFTFRCVAGNDVYPRRRNVKISGQRFSYRFVRHSFHRRRFHRNFEVQIVYFFHRLGFAARSCLDNYFHPPPFKDKFNKNLRPFLNRFKLFFKFDF